MKNSKKLVNMKRKEISKISFSGIYIGKTIIENEKVITFKPDDDAKLWVSIGEDFLEKIYILEKMEESV